MFTAEAFLKPESRYNASTDEWMNKCNIQWDIFWPQKLMMHAAKQINLKYYAKRNKARYKRKNIL